MGGKEGRSVSHVRSQRGHGWARSRKEPRCGGRALGVKMSQRSLESEGSQLTLVAGRASSDVVRRAREVLERKRGEGSEEGREGRDGGTPGHDERQEKELD